MAYVGRPPSNATLSSGDIADGIIVAADLAPDSVGASELADDAVDTAAIADSVTLVTPNLGTPSAVTLTNATFPAGHVLKTTHYNPSPIADAGYTSGTQTMMTTSFTPLSATNNLLIQFRWAWQFYGNNSTVSAACSMAFYHGSTTLNNDVITWHDNTNYSNTFHRVKDMTQTFYIDENSGATTGAARTIYMTFTPTTNRTYVSDGYGNYYINIMEFA